MKSLPDLLRQSVARYRDHAAIIMQGQTLTYTDLNQLSDQAASALLAQGVSQGQRVALYCINCAEFAIAYFGILKAGATVVPINVLLKPVEIEFILNDADARMLIYHRKFEQSVVELRGNLAQLDFSVVIDGDSNHAVTWSNFLKVKNRLRLPEIDADNDLAVILYTSGTTGRPKGAMLSHANLSANVSSVLEAMRWRLGQEIILLVLPMFHAFAGTVGMLATLASGCAFVPVARFDPDKIAATVAETRATIFLGVPSMYGVMLRLKPVRIKMFATLRYCVSGGSALPVKVLQQFEQRFGVKIYEGDGPTECSPVTCVNPIDGITKPGTVGRPVPRVEMKIFDDDGIALPSGQIGEIGVRGFNVMKGYWNQIEETEKVFRGEWFLTGDLGCMDDDGYFSIVDRKKDLVIVNGMNVYPKVVEDVLYKMKQIVEAAVVGEAHAVHGEVPVAYVVLESGAAVSESEIRAWCREALGRHQVPRRIYIVAELPKNATGKILKRELSKRGEVERGVGPLG